MKRLEIIIPGLLLLAILIIAARACDQSSPPPAESSSEFYSPVPENLRAKSLGAPSADALLLNFKSAIQSKKAAKILLLFNWDRVQQEELDQAQATAHQLAKCDILNVEVVPLDWSFSASKEKNGFTYTLNVTPQKQFRVRCTNTRKERSVAFGRKGQTFFLANWAPKPPEKTKN